MICNKTNTCTVMYNKNKYNTITKLLINFNNSMSKFLVGNKTNIIMYNINTPIDQILFTVVSVHFLFWTEP